MKLRTEKEGFTLLELMIACGILTVVLTGLLSAYISCLELNETTKNSNLALGAIQEELENLRKTSFSSLNDNYTFHISGEMYNSSLGIAIINRTNSSYYRVDTGVCWKQRNNRIVGECAESGGTLTFTDDNGNGILDSPVEITTYMSQR